MSPGSTGTWSFDVWIMKNTKFVQSKKFISSDCQAMFLFRGSVLLSFQKLWLLHLFIANTVWWSCSVIRAAIMNNLLAGVALCWSTRDRYRSNCSWSDCEKKKHSCEDEEVMKRSQVCLIEVNQNTNSLICPPPPHPSDTIILSDIKVFASCWEKLTSVLFQSPPDSTTTTPQQLPQTSAGSFRLSFISGLQLIQIHHLKLDTVAGWEQPPFTARVFQFSNVVKRWRTTTKWFFWFSK